MAAKGDLSEVGKIKEIYDDFHIDFVGKEEQENIEKILSNKNCHVVSHSKLVKL